MSYHFQWILTCVDDGTSYTLENDPIGFDDVTYTLERHATYHGIFNQFTSNLKFHNDGGGKQFIDAKYAAYDINGQILITVLVDRDGRGVVYDTLFNGKLNLASYQDDTIHTIVNIEQSDLMTKLNTRADVPVSINVPTVSLAGQQFNASMLDSLDTGNYAGDTYIFEDPQILPGHIFKVVTTDIDNVNVGSSVYFTTQGQSGSSGTSGATSIRITSVSTGSLSISFTSPGNTIYLYEVGVQLSLGQSTITPVPTTTLQLEGIPINYESLFTMADDIASGTFTFQSTDPNWTGAPTGYITYGQLVSAIIYDSLNNPVYDQVMYTGQSIRGPGMVSSDGLTKIQIIGITPSSVTVAFSNANVASAGAVTNGTATQGAAPELDLFIGDISAVASPNPGLGTPPGSNKDSWLVTTGQTTQVFEFLGNNNTGDIVADQCYQSFCGFDANTVFDNLDAFAWGAYEDWGSQNDVTKTNLPPVCSSVDQPWIEYPIHVNYNIQLSGTVNWQYTGSFIPDESSFNAWTSIEMSWGGGNAATGTNPLAAAWNAGQRKTLWAVNSNTPGGCSQGAPMGGTIAGVPNSLDRTWDFNISVQGQIDLQVGDSIWFYAWLTFFTDDSGSSVKVPVTFTFTQSVMDFQIPEIAEPTTASSIMIHEAFNQVTDSIVDSDGNFYSEFYGRTDSAKISYAQDGPGSLRAISSGLCVRGRLDKYISISLNDLFNSMAAIDNIGMEIDSQNRLRVEPLSFFFDSATEIISLPNVYDYQTLNENSLYYNQIEVGYDKWETELYFKNGLDEVNAKRYYATRVGAAKGTVLQKYGSPVKSILAVSNKLSLVSSLIAGNYAIELTRRKNYAWSRDDFKYDNDNFIFCLRRSITTGACFLPANCLVLSQLVTFFTETDIVTITNTNSNNITDIGIVSISTYNDQTILVLAADLSAEQAPNCTITTGMGRSVTLPVQFIGSQQAVLLNGAFNSIQPGDSLSISGTLYNNTPLGSPAIVTGTNVTLASGVEIGEALVSYPIAAVNGAKVEAVKLLFYQPLTIGPPAFQTLVFLNGAVAGENAPACTITDPDNFFTETADQILAQPMTNVDNPAYAQSWLNMSITPARMLQNNFNQVAACLQTIRGNIQFLDGEGNFVATSKFANPGYAQQQDYAFSTLAENASLSYADGNVRNVDPLWAPEIYRFEYPLTYQQFKTIRANPNGYISFYKFADQVKQGFILSMDYNLKTGMTRFELLKTFNPEILLAEAENATLIESENELLIQTQTLKT